MWPTLNGWEWALSIRGGLEQDFESSVTRIQPHLPHVLALTDNSIDAPPASLTTDGMSVMILVRLCFRSPVIEDYRTIGPQSKISEVES
jgi:hypothetical protein